MTSPTYSQASSLSTDQPLFIERLRRLLVETRQDSFTTATLRNQPVNKITSLKHIPSHREFAPELAYGRHRGPIAASAHPASVLICLVKVAEDWSIPLTLRSPKLSDHAGQISLPGGRIDQGESAWEAATREFEEELGVSKSKIEPIGALSPLYVFASHHYVQVCVGCIQGDVEFRPQADEVAEVIPFHLPKLIEEETQVVATLQRGSAQYESRGFRIGQHLVWGATAMVLSDFRDTFLRCMTTR